MPGVEEGSSKRSQRWTRRPVTYPFVELVLRDRRAKRPPDIEQVMMPLVGDLVDNPQRSYFGLAEPRGTTPLFCANRGHFLGHPFGVGRQPFIHSHRVQSVVGVALKSRIPCFSSAIVVERTQQ